MGGIGLEVGRAVSVGARTDDSIDETSETIDGTGPGMTVGAPATSDVT